jgi:hypothetical protein
MSAVRPVGRRDTKEVELSENQLNGKLSERGAPSIRVYEYLFDG